MDSTYAWPHDHRDVKKKCHLCQSQVRDNCYHWQERNASITMAIASHYGNDWSLWQQLVTMAMTGHHGTINGWSLWQHLVTMATPGHYGNGWNWQKQPQVLGWHWSSQPPHHTHLWRRRESGQTPITVLVLDSQQFVTKCKYTLSGCQHVWACLSVWRTYFLIWHMLWTGHECTAY